MLHNRWGGGVEKKWLEGWGWGLEGLHVYEELCPLMRYSQFSAVQNFHRSAHQTTLTILASPYQSHDS